jgi:recombination protein RecT
MTSSSSNALVALERQFDPLVPHFQQVLGQTMPVERLIRTVIVSVERNAKLLECNRQTLFNSAMSAAVLGLEVDGVTGQGFLIPFKERAQLIIGYKGYNTIGARADLTITGDIVRTGDFFDYDLGTGEVHHKKPIGNSQARIGQAWAKASHNNRPPILVVMDIDELLAVKDKSPGAKKSDSPWNDPLVGFPAMCAKTAKRRLARSLPMIHRYQYAAAMEQAVEEQGRGAWISPDKGVVIEGSLLEPSDTPTTQQLIGPRGEDRGQPAAAPAGPPLHGTAHGGPDQSDVIAARARLKTAALNGSTADERIGSLKLEWESLPNDLKAAITEGQGCPAAYKAAAKTGIAP